MLMVPSVSEMPILNLNMSHLVPTSSALELMVLRQSKMRNSQHRRDTWSSRLLLLTSKLSQSVHRFVFVTSRNPPLLLLSQPSPSQPEKVFAGVSQNCLNKRKQSELGHAMLLPLRSVLPRTGRIRCHQLLPTKTLRPVANVLIAPSSSVDAFISITYPLRQERETWYAHDPVFDVRLQSFETY